MKQSKVSVQSKAVLTKSVTTVNPPPSQGAPPPPVGFVPAKPGGRKRLRVMRSQSHQALPLAEELAAATNAGAEFGPKIPSLADVGALLEIGGRWTQERERAQAWLDYARDQEVTAWLPALADLETMAKVFDFALTRDPSVKDRFPQLAAFYDASKQVGIKAAVTRRANAAKKAAKPTTG
jgi:hypothetical protein